ncbi:Circadian locomoter output cycles protein kaput, putative [Pediculus humanus corporis]|uniref:Circadian locomoter output cycles protein kaput, putative n=1 Tax=Pediculus humanus subsp. corporis TaxID=121224 RepID=E0VT39_PEDHC|nr:Circadian locomoter output cycles protein kaput, putative [Pediculus humanus corporis]EEB16545.1 Circadian locomoter output cycles protein kaput, putative [Pediculus humanus corporis]
MDDDTDDKDDTKRRSRNLSEKKRRDQFNMLINELSSMVSTNNRKMDKSTVLKSTIAFLESHNELAVRSRAHEIQEDWKPSFLSNEEFAHLILEAVEGFIIAFSTCGTIIYVSGSITSLLGYLPGELMKPSVTIFDILYEEDQPNIYNILSNSEHGFGSNIGKENQMEFSCHLRRGVDDYRDEPVYQLVHFVGYFKTDSSKTDVDNMVSSTNRYTGDGESSLMFVGTGRLDTPQLIREMTISDNLKSEFTSRHNLDWKFLALDSRATPIIGYVQLEVVGTSGYDYYHIDDLDKIVVCHETLMEKGEGTSCYYRFLTKGQQWIWLQTRFYISYHQWNSKPEFIVCTHRVVSYVDVMNEFKKYPCDDNTSDSKANTNDSTSKSKRKSCSLDQVASSPWSSKSSVGPVPQIEVSSPTSATKSQRKRYQGPGSDSASMASADSPGSRHSQLTTLTAHSQRVQNTSKKSLSMTKLPVLSPAQASTTFIESQHQYAVAAIPLQPIIGFPGTAVVTSIPTQELLCHPQAQLSDHVKRKQHELNQLRQLMYRKEEELQQCLLVQGRCGIVSVPSYTVSGECSGTNQSTNQSGPDLYVTSHSIVASPLTVTTISPSDIRLQPANSSSESHSGGIYNDQHSQSDSELIPFQFSQQQAQFLFTNISPPPNSH